MLRELDIVIPAAGMSRRAKIGGSKSLIELANGETIIGRQTRICRELFPTSKIVVVVGFEQTRMRRSLPVYIQTIENPEFETVNVAHSLYLGMLQTHSKSVLIVYGDLIFNTKGLSNIITNESWILVDESTNRENEVGVTCVDGFATTFSYGLPTKWSQITLLTGKELELFKRISSDPQKKRRFGFEILNEVLECGGKLRVVRNANMNLMEVDSQHDIKQLNNFNYDERKRNENPL